MSMDIVKIYHLLQNEIWTMHSFLFIIWSFVFNTKSVIVGLLVVFNMMLPANINIYVHEYLMQKVDEPMTKF